ncbi:single-stranded DNA-binding protein [Nakamurella lactea]|jgi:single-strand DNA-binding protein|uniref:single-stranded DNA-binding protein n=1 Tax=Nakamurella lactea TaxID=459515 RepID=UPI000428062C|nr:single-stranded DNA-binding protein [Nakamurella lactea]
MSMQQQATAWVTGNVAYTPEPGGEDPRFRVRLRVLNNRRWLDRQTNEWKESEVNGTDVVCWGELAHNVVSSIQKGQPVVVYGRLEENSWVDQDGASHRRTRVVADIVAHDLSRGSARFQRLNFNAGATSDTGNGSVTSATDDTADDSLTSDTAADDTVAGESGIDGAGAALSDPWANAQTDRDDDNLVTVS